MLRFFSMSFFGLGDLGGLAAGMKQHIREAKEQGLPAHVRLQEVGELYEDDGEVSAPVVLEVLPESGAVYQTKVKVSVLERQAPVLKEGTEWPARIHPSDPDFLLIDWGEGFEAVVYQVK